MRADNVSRLRKLGVRTPNAGSCSAISINTKRFRKVVTVKLFVCIHKLVHAFFAAEFHRALITTDEYTRTFIRRNTTCDANLEQITPAMFFVNGPCIPLAFVAAEVHGPTPGASFHLDTIARRKSSFFLFATRKTPLVICWGKVEDFYILFPPTA